MAFNVEAGPRSTTRQKTSDAGRPAVWAPTRRRHDRVRSWPTTLLLMVHADVPKPVCFAELFVAVKMLGKLWLLINETPPAPDAP